jgi:hypothetical protein
MDTLKRNTLTLFPKIDPELEREASARYLEARAAVVHAALNYWSHNARLDREYRRVYQNAQTSYEAPQSTISA